LDSDPQAILRVPRQNAYEPDGPLRWKIAQYFAVLTPKTAKQIEPRLPDVMPRWGKVRIVDGDSICCSWVGDSRGDKGRNMSFIRVTSILRLFCVSLNFKQYEIEVKDRGHPGTWVPTVCYGQLKEILVCKLPSDRKFWGKFSGKVRLLAVITPYRTGGQDAALDIVRHFQATTPIVADIQSIMAVVGRVETRGKWYLVDRSGAMMRPEFIPSDELEGGEVQEGSDGATVDSE